MTRELRGTPAAPGAAVAAPWIYRAAEVGTQAGLSLDEASTAAVAEIDALGRRLRALGREAEAEIMDAQTMMAADPELHGAAAKLAANGVRPADAIVAAGEEVALQFEAIGDEFLAARGADVRDVTARIARIMTGGVAPRLEQRSVVVGVDLPPSVTVELDRALLAGIALERGSRTSHAAILSRSLGIPAVVGVAGVCEAARTAKAVGIDGGVGVVHLDPDAGTTERLASDATAAGERARADAGLATIRLATADGHRVTCAANIGEPGEAATAFTSGAEAIGLFRTEFAFAGRATAPDAATQAAAYADVLRSADGKEVVFRLADIGGDKPIAYLPIEPEANPFLGVRAIRLAERHPDLLPTQLRAILRASADTGQQASIMAPMVADEADVDLVLRLVADARAAVPDAPTPRVGIMVEIPSAVLLADRLATRVEFMSIGTNDLTQYLLAADRSNAALAARQDPLHPVVLRAIARVVEAAAGASCAVAVCGEMAGDPAGALLLVGLGVDELSMEWRAFGPVKRAISARRLPALVALATNAQQLSTAAEVRRAVETSA
ncbi:MAG: phosphoenolpyruvate--protein phosphotransferase [Chloroflexota bacterium]|nr:phosphoenolpyruvate--protein phosphotransferase [Chloroflexota bacterium]